jgi:hypothetical protein
MRLCWEGGEQRAKSKEEEAHEPSKGRARA